MRALFLAAVFLAPPAVAQVFDCPKFYPYQDTVLPGGPYGHNGKGVVAKGELSGTRWMGGEFNDTFGIMQGPPPKKVKGGLDSEVPTFARWLVCDYSSGAQWWEELRLANVKQCTLKIRNRAGRDPMEVKLVCK